MEFNGKFYLSKKTHTFLKMDSLQNPNGWFEFSHPATKFDLPKLIAVNQNNNSPTGYDTNKNRIRDDYELKVIFSSLEPTTIDLALKAGQVYGDLIALSSNLATVDTTYAKNLLNQLLYTGQCKQKIQNTGKQVWRESWYFNDFERVILKYKNQNLLVDLLNESELDADNKDPCVRLLIN